jgi:OOP family OmpA-OmpF porin
MLKHLKAALLFTTTLGFHAASAKVLQVPSAYPTISGGLIHAESGDTVLVGPGTYRENVTLAQGVVLLGQDALKCIIDGMRKGPAVTVVAGSEIGKFTITNGVDGVLCENASARIHHNWIIDNEGAGIGAFIALPQIDNNVIYGNRWSGILVWGAKALDTRIENNVIMRNGYSGLALRGPTRIVVRNNVFTENREYGIFSDPAAGQSQVIYNNIYKNYMPFNRYTKVNKSNISTDPMFLSPGLGNPNFLPAAKSPMVRRGYEQVDIGLLAHEIVAKVDGDKDNDGVSDSKDACPELAEDQDGYQDDDGCPDLDNDKDGISDAQDKCPNDAEDKDGFEDSDGCPDLDNDKDGVADAQDKCPNQPETMNGIKDDDGCPDVEVKAPEDNFVLEGVNFRTGSADLTEDSYAQLDKVVEALVKYPDRRFEIAGHTDNAATDRVNLKLSLDRANSVRDYLLKKGVDAQRLVAKGYGSSRPKADNKTAEGRTLNRRIEFYRIK